MLLPVACVAVHCLLLFGLGLWISLLRFVRKDYYFGNGGPTGFLTKLSRAHGNTAEFSPMLVILTLSLALADENTAIVAASMILGTASRVLVVIGFLSSRTLEHISLPKAVGAVGTYASGLVMAALLFKAFACWT